MNDGIPSKTNTNTPAQWTVITVCCHPVKHEWMTMEVHSTDSVNSATHFVTIPIITNCKSDITHRIIYFSSNKKQYD